MIASQSHPAAVLASRQMTLLVAALPAAAAVAQGGWGICLAGYRGLHRQQACLGVSPAPAPAPRWRPSVLLNHPAMTYRKVSSHTW